MAEPIVQIDTKRQLKTHSLNDVTEDPKVIKIYGNGFQCGATLSDASIMVKHNETPIALLSMSLSAFKSLHHQIGQILDVYSKNFNIEISSFEELTSKLHKQTGK